MRDKILQYLQLSGIDPDKMIVGLVEMYRQLRVHACEGKLDDPSEKAIQLVERSLVSQKSEVEDRFVEVLSAILVEDELDQINAFLQSPIGRKMNEISRKMVEDLNDVSMAWHADVMRDIELELSLLLG